MFPSKILYICDAMPLSENFSGASSFKYSHLKLLLSCFPDTRIRILILKYYEVDNFQANELKKDFPSGNYEIEILDLRGNRSFDIRRKMYGLSTNYHSIRYFHNFINSKNLENFKNIVVKFNPDLIWTENYIENYFSLCLKDNIPVIYSHYDFIWKLMKLKHKETSLKANMTHLIRRKSEISQIRRNRNIVSGSQSEITELERINPLARTVLLPTAYRSHDVPDKGILPDIRIVHVGNLQATSNKVGLHRFLTVCWPVLLQLPNPPEFWVIGNVSNGYADEVVMLLKQPNIRVLGHVDDLSTVLRPFDIHVVPYEHDTGTRTRIPLVLNHQQLLISTRNASNGLPGLKDQENCLLVDSLEEMIEKIKLVLKDQGTYRHMAQNGKALYEKKFTSISQKDRLIEFIRNISV